jgi:hypothetical protein
MPLPDWTDAGLLPPGSHPATLSDIYQRFVVDEPSSTREQRELLYTALSIHLRLIQRLIPAGRAWVDGSFAMRTELSPSDVDVAIGPADWAQVENLDLAGRAQLYVLLTMRDVAVADPAIWLSKLHPVSGLVDAYLIYPDQDATWDEQWSRVMGPDRALMPDHKKGYAEVTW